MNIRIKLEKAALFGLLFFFSAQCYGQKEEKIYKIVAEMPEFPGGVDSLAYYLSVNVKYPYDDRRNGVEGVAFVQFVIEKDGSVSNVEIVQKTEDRATEEMKKEALRVVSNLPRWTPGYIDEGEPVRVAYEMPIGFKLGSGKLKKKKRR